VHDVNKSNTPAGDRIHFLQIDNQNLWLGVSWHGLDKMNILNETITHYSHNDKDSNSLSSRLINYITEDKNNDIWIATYTGLDRLNQNTNKFTHYLKQSNVLSTCVGTDGMIWAGTTDGFYYFDAHKNSFVKYVNQNAPLTITNVLHILEDDQHNLWLTTGSAILKIDRKTNSINVYGKDYGVHYNSFYIGDNYKLKNGQLLIGDQNGYYLISPLALNLTKAMVLNFTGFKIGDEEVQVSQDAAFNVNTAMAQAKSIKLNYKQNIFSFTFSTTDYANSSEIKYLVMLENYDNAWRDIGTEHKAYFFNVTPGNYIFHVKAINPNGIWTEKSISIIISPPWWSTWWFRITAVVFAITVLYSVIRWRLKEKFRLQLEQSEKERQLAMLNQKTSELEAQALRAEMDQVLKLQQMRTRIASDLHDDIGSTLTSISYYSELVKMQLKEDDASLKPMLDKIGGSARTTINAMSDIVWIINPKNDTTENLVSRMKHYAAEMLGERNIQYTFDTNEEMKKLELNMQHRKNLYLIYKEAVHNAVKYSACSNIEIDFTATDHTISLSIHDNGKGFDTQNASDGNGLVNMKKRAEEISAHFEVCAAQAKGTHIKLTCKIT
jgi:signal transduction histidine kinase